MKRITVFAGRTFKEVVRDPLTIIFGIGFPVVLILLMNLLQSNIPGMAENTPHFMVANFTPSMMVFGLAFISLFLGQLIAKDRNSAFLSRLLASPLKPFEYISGYTLPFIPLALVEGIICFGVAMLLGLEFSARMLIACLCVIPTALLFTALGVIFGALLTPQQVGGMGSVLVNLAAWLSGAFFAVEMLGGAFETICRLLPFYHAVELIRAALSGSSLTEHLIWVLGYAAVLFILGSYLFKKRSRT